MSKELELYKAFIDGLVERKDSMTALWVKGNGFPKTEDNKAKNDLLATLTPEQKDVLAEMLQDEHIAGIHDTLAYINEMMDLEGLELHQDGESYPNDYFESLHYDFISRCGGFDRHGAAGFLYRCGLLSPRDAADQSGTFICSSQRRGAFSGSGRSAFDGVGL